MKANLLDGRTGLFLLTLPNLKRRGFSGYAQAIASRYRLTGLPDPKEFWMFSGLDFTQKPNFCNHQPKLLRNFGRPALSLFHFYRYRSIQFVRGIIAQFGKGRKPYRASPDSSPALKCGVFSGVVIRRHNEYEFWL